MKSRILALVSLMGFAFLTACDSGNRSTNRPGDEPDSDASVIAKKSEVDEFVENGTAYDRGVVDLGKATKLVLPNTATVRKGGEAGKVQLFMAKTLSFGGHPGEAMSIRSGRNSMGCAVRAEGNALIVATYGEWDSHIEGGAYVELVALVPEGVEFELRKGLSGENSIGQEPSRGWLAGSKDSKGGHWYGPTSPTEQWTVVPAVPDPEKTASK